MKKSLLDFIYYPKILKDPGKFLTIDQLQESKTHLAKTNIIEL